jgi:ribosomal protein L37AE/L43A
MFERIKKHFKGDHYKFYSKYLEDIEETGKPDSFKASCPLCNEGTLRFNNLSGMWSCDNCRDNTAGFMAFYINQNNGNLKGADGFELLGSFCIDHGIEPENFEEFPDWVMSGVAGDFAEIFGSHFESPGHFFYFSYLTIFGLLVSDILPKLVKSGISAQPRLYIVLLGTSAEARKSTAIDKTIEHFKVLYYFEPLTAGDDGMKMALCEGAASGEALGRLLSEDTKVLLTYDELKSFTAKANIQHASLLPITNTLFEKNSAANEKADAKKSIVVEDGYLALLAACTTDTYIDIFSPKYIDIGFNNRLFIVPGDSNKRISFPEDPPDEEKRYLKCTLDERLEFLWKLHSEGQEIGFDKDARKKWDKYYNTLRDRHSVHTKRIDQYGLRLMPLLALNDLKSSIDVITVNKVIALLEWQYKVRQLYDPIQSDDRVAKMEEKIRRCLRKKKKWAQWELQRDVNYSREGIWVWKNARDNLVSNFEMQKKSSKKFESLICDVAD